MAVSSNFETLTLTRSNSEQHASVLRQLERMVERSAIKIVDIRRTRDQLVITFRRLSS